MDHEPPLRISRKQAFGKIGKLALIAGTLGFLPPERQKAPEVVLNSSAVVLDFFNLEQGELPTSLPTTDESVKDYVVAAFKKERGDHGALVVKVGQKADEYFGFKELDAPVQISVVGAVEIGEIRRDKTGDPTVDLLLSSNKIDRLVGQSTGSVVNLSLQVGKFPVTCDFRRLKAKYPEMIVPQASRIGFNGVKTYTDQQGNEITKGEYELIQARRHEKEPVVLKPDERDVEFLDGYAGPSTESNLIQMVEIARHHPDKMFVVAGGNPTIFNGLQIPDIRAARQVIEKAGLWPKNLVVVGFTGNPGDGGIEEWQASYGADIYVSTKFLQKLGFSGASSFATPVVTEVVRHLIDEGFNTHDKVKNALFKLCKTKEYWQGQERKEYLVLDDQLVTS